MARTVEAHPPVTSVVHLTISSHGEVAIAIQYDALAFALHRVSAEVSDEEIHELWRSPATRFSELLSNSHHRWSTEVRLLVDEKEIVPSISQPPTLEDFREWIDTDDGLPHPEAMRIVMHAMLASGTQRISLRVPELLDQVLLVIERPGLERSILPLDPGEFSPPIDVSMVSSPVSNPTAITESMEVDNRTNHDLPSVDQEWLQTSWRFIRQGFLHIIPFGADHALFVLGLFLMASHGKALLIQVSAFTVAHTVTMTLASLHWVLISPRIVEPLIALSILVVAIENLWLKISNAWKTLTAFGFGLIHGLGFASVLVELNLPTNQLILGLGSFSVGVELGHLAILCVAYLLLGWSRQRPWYRQRVVLPISAGIGAIALYMLFERL